MLMILSVNCPYLVDRLGFCQDIVRILSGYCQAIVLTLVIGEILQTLSSWQPPSSCLASRPEEV